MPGCADRAGNALSRKQRTSGRIMPPILGLKDRRANRDLVVFERAVPRDWGARASV